MTIAHLTKNLVINFKSMNNESMFKYATRIVSMLKVLSFILLSFFMQATAFGQADTITILSPTTNPYPVAVNQNFSVTCRAFPPSGQTLARVTFYYWRDGVSVPLCSSDPCVVNGTGPDFVLNTARVTALPNNPGNDLILCMSTTTTGHNRSLSPTGWVALNVSAGTADTTAPSVPSGLSTSNIAQTSATLNWSASTDAVGVTGYQVSINNGTAQNATGTSYSATGLTAGTTYNFKVRARDAAGNWSAYSSTVNFTTSSSGGGTPDTITITSPTTEPYAVSVNQNFTVTCTAYPPAGQTLSRVTFYYWRDGVSVPLCSSDPCVVNGSGPTYTMSSARITALPGNPGNDSVLCMSTTNTGHNRSLAQGGELLMNVTGVADTTAPSAPSGFASSSITSTSFNLVWSASTDNVAVTRYEVQRVVPTPVTTVATVNAPTLTASLTGLTPSTAYQVKVRACDAANNCSAYSSTLTVTTTSAPVDTTAPSVPSNLVASGVQSTSANLGWSASTDAVGVTGYQVSINNGAGIDVASTSYTASGLTASTAYNFKVRARDAAGNWSAYSSAVNFTTTAASTVNLPTMNFYESSKTTVHAIARVQSSPAQITLYWANMSGRTPTAVNIYRKIKTATSWGSAIGTPSATATSWTDSSVTIGTYYEYKIVMTTANTGTAYGYVASGIQVQPVDYRGKVILLIDTTIASAISSQVTTLTNDLTADGWIVVPFNISQSTSKESVKTTIANAYNADPTNVKALFVLGHIAVPRSGAINPDGHGDHQGAWPADSYYADLNGNWTDNSLNHTNGSNSFYNNIPGDGKFDQNDVPSVLELEMGRVDFKNMDAFSASVISDDPQLYINYLNRLHNFKVKSFVPQKRGLLVDNFSGMGLAQSGWRNMSALVGPANITNNSQDYTSGFVPYFQQVNNQSYLWTYACGGGGFTQASGIGTTWEFSDVNTGGVFNMSYGSYFGDWDNNNNFLRAFMTGGSGLTSVWSSAPNYYFHHMGMGDTIGYGVRLSISNKAQTIYDPVFAYSNVNVHAALHGDPTLRMDYILPPSNLQLSNSGGKFNMSWSASSESGLTGYHVYQISANTITRLTTSPVTGNSFLSNVNFTTGQTFMVRAVKLHVSESGSYYNLSLGAKANN
jgi:chitodextrinase